ncbi:MAG: hypothetical protein AB1414_05550 [bacterium]
MGKRIFLGLIIGGVCGVSVLAQDKEKGDPLSLVYEQVYPEFEKTKLVLEYKSDEPIVDVIFDEATMTVKEARALGIKGLEKRKATEIVKVRYPKVVAPKDAVHPEQRIIKGVVTFLNEKGSITNQIFLRENVIFMEDAKERRWINDQCYISSNGEYAGIVTSVFRKKGEYDVTTEETRFSLVDKNGNIILGKKPLEPNISECYIECRISDDGKRILIIYKAVERLPSVIYLYNEKGEQIWKQQYEGDIFDMLMSKNGKYIAGEISIYVGQHKGRALFENWLIFYDIDNEKSWKYKLESKDVRHWVILSENGDVDVRNNDIRKNETIYSFTKDGKLKDTRGR